MKSYGTNNPEGEENNLSPCVRQVPGRAVVGHLERLCFA